jgi:hypothetical protein
MHPERMAGHNQTDGPRNAASAWHAAIAARQTAADGRDRQANERERRADKREALADQREHLANLREALADKRERAADQREATQNQRQCQLDERTHMPDWAITGTQQRVLDTIERGQALLAFRSARLDRQKAAVKRAQAHHDRQQAATERTAARNERHAAARQPGPSDLTKRAKAARTSLRSHPSHRNQRGSHRQPPRRARRHKPPTPQPIPADRRTRTHRSTQSPRFPARLHRLAIPMEFSLQAASPALECPARVVCRQTS